MAKKENKQSQYSMYSIKIKRYNHIFKKSISVYREAVDFLIEIYLREWDELSKLTGNDRSNTAEHMIHKTDRHPNPICDFDIQFYKFPNYLRRAAIREALGKISSYKSNLANWEQDPVNKRPGYPKAGYIFPALYKGDMYKYTKNAYQMKIRVFIRNTWDWITVDLRKSDVDYIERRCKGRTKCSPTLQKRGKEWFLDFPFKEEYELTKTPGNESTIVAVDLGINSAATASVMLSDGTVLGRHFCKLPKENDCLMHSMNRIKKAQQHGAKRTPRLWARAKGINDDIAVKTAKFIMDIAAMYNADAIVFEHLDINGKKRGSKKQRLHHWRAQYVQQMVTDKAHRMKMHISHVNAWGTSRLAYDGSGKVLRGKSGGFNTYELCRFQNGKIYNCDLSASYNIGARYFIRELLKSFSETERLDILAKVPKCSKRSTCTWIDLIDLNVAAAAFAAA